MLEGSPVNGQWIRDVQARFERPLLAYAARLMGDAERGRDLVQDAFARLCDQPPSQVLPQFPQVAVHGLPESCAGSAAHGEACDASFHTKLRQ